MNQACKWVECKRTMLWLLLVVSCSVHSEGGVLHVNTQIFPPYTTEDHQGVEDLLATEIFTRLGYKVVITPVHAERGLINLDQGIDDVILSRIPGLEKQYANIVQQQEPAVTWRFVAFTKTPGVRIRHWDELANYHVALVTGWKIFEQNVTRYKTLTKVSNADQLFRMLDLGRVDVAVYAERPGYRLLEKMHIQGIYAVQPPLSITEKYFYLNKRHAELVPRADAVLRQIKRDGTYQRIVDTVAPSISRPAKP